MPHQLESKQVEICWDGITRQASLGSEEASIRGELCDAAKNYRWDLVFELLQRNPHLVNATRPSGLSWFAPLHQVAHSGATVEIVQRMTQMGAWRSLQSARGERPFDVAERQGHRHLLEVLQPVYLHQVPLGILHRIQAEFHKVIAVRVEQLVVEHALRLPELETLLELERPRLWFPVPGMYGGFSFWLQTTGVDAVLVSESWSRVEGGSGQRHEITSAGSKLVDEGFV